MQVGSQPIRNKASRWEKKKAPLAPFQLRSVDWPVPVRQLSALQPAEPGVAFAGIAEAKKALDRLGTTTGLVAVVTMKPLPNRNGDIKVIPLLRGDRLQTSLCHIYSLGPGKVLPCTSARAVDTQAGSAELVVEVVEMHHPDPWESVLSAGLRGLRKYLESLVPGGRHILDCYRLVYKGEIIGQRVLRATMRVTTDYKEPLVKRSGENGI